MICTRLVRGTSDTVLITTQTVGALRVRRVRRAVRLGADDVVG